LRDSASSTIVASVIAKISLFVFDKFTAEWRTVREMRVMTSDSDDEKRLRQAENRALKVLKE
jgi:hypothetical protein